MSNPKAGKASNRDVAWIEGLRGLAALFVLTSHLSLAYAFFLEAPRHPEEGPIHWYNLPFIRIFSEGSPWVAIFVTLTGFTNALRPLQQARSGDVDVALSSLASSCLRRTSRLVLPCTVATLFCWVLAEMGAFSIGAAVDSSWLKSTCLPPSGSFFGAIGTVVVAIADTWTWHTNELERNQWAMLYFLKGALYVYLFLLATVRVKPKHRMFLSLALVIYGLYGEDPETFMPIFTGIYFAEVSLTSAAHAFRISRSRKLQVLPYIAFLLGWLCISYPKHKHYRTTWSRYMQVFGEMVFPLDDVHDFYSQVGATLIIGGILFSPFLQKVLCARPLQWLGARSFAIYLVHGPVLRSFLNWILFYDTKSEWHMRTTQSGRVLGRFLSLPIPPKERFYWAIPLYLALTMYLSCLWHNHVEPPCEQVTKWLEKKICEPQEELLGRPRDVAVKSDLGPQEFGSPLSRATTPVNELLSILPRP